MELFPKNPLYFTFGHLHSQRIDAGKPRCIVYARIDRYMSWVSFHLAVHMYGICENV